MTNTSGKGSIELMVVMFAIGTLLGIGLPMLFGNYLEWPGWLPYVYVLLAGFGVALLFGVFNRNIPLALSLFAIVLVAASFFIVVGLYPSLLIVIVVLIVLYNLFYKWIDRMLRRWVDGKKRRKDDNVP
jgi:hypothetical protein